MVLFVLRLSSRNVSSCRYSHTKRILTFCNRAVGIRRFIESTTSVLDDDMCFIDMRDFGFGLWQIGYPVLIRAAYALGGLGSGFAENREEFILQAEKGFAYSNQLIVDQVLYFIWQDLCHFPMVPGSTYLLSDPELTPFLIDPVGLPAVSGCVENALQVTFFLLCPTVRLVDEDLKNLTR